jgi:uncharacterized protein YecT (DUF1311 family)
MTIFFVILTSTLLFSCSSIETDSKRLSKLKYMDIADGVDCSNQNGTTLEERICLNLKFQKVDSILNQGLDSLINDLPYDKAIKLEDDQVQWITNRREQSEKAAEGLRGHMLGIIYLQKMIEITENRIKDLLHTK